VRPQGGGAAGAVRGGHEGGSGRPRAAAPRPRRSDPPRGASSPPTEAPCPARPRPRPRPVPAPAPAPAPRFNPPPSTPPPQVVDKDADAVLDEIEAAILNVCGGGGGGWPEPWWLQGVVWGEEAARVAQGLRRGRAPRRQGGARARAPHPACRRAGPAAPPQVATTILRGEGFAYDVPSRAKTNQMYIKVPGGWGVGGGGWGVGGGGWGVGGGGWGGGGGGAGCGGVGVGGGV
jgi:hypothetical protein